MPLIPDIGDLADLSNALRAWVITISTYFRKLEEDEKRDIITAIEELGRAAIMTRAYLAARALAGDAPNDGLVPQQALSEKWLQVGLLLTRLKQPEDYAVSSKIRELVERSFAKGYYWADPIHWNNPRADIKLDKLVEEISSVLLDMRGRLPN